MYHTNDAVVQARSLKNMRFTVDCQSITAHATGKTRALACRLIGRARGNREIS